MSRFQTLMRREWMQHHRAWLLIMLLPPALALLLMTFGHLDLARPVEPLQIVLFVTAAVSFGVFAIFATATIFQLPSLARRDRQDRSEEFWLSLPTSHSASLGATLAMHLVVMPLVALGIGYLLSQLLALVITARMTGLASWVDLPWPRLLGNELLALLGTAFGTVVGMLWLSPLLLLTMVASAWLKRWGTAAVAVALSLGHVLLVQFYHQPVVGHTLQALFVNAARSVISADPQLAPGNAAAAQVWLFEAPRLLLADAAAVLSNLLQPLFAFALLFSAGCFLLLVLRRGRPA